MNDNELYDRLTELQDTVDRVRDSLIDLRTQVQPELGLEAEPESERPEESLPAPPQKPAVDLEAVQEAPVDDPPPSAQHLKGVTDVLVSGGFWEGYRATLLRLITSPFGLVFAEMGIGGAEGFVRIRASDVEPYDGP